MGRCTDIWGEDVLKFRLERHSVEEKDEKREIIQRFKLISTGVPIFPTGPLECNGKEKVYLSVGTLILSLLKKFDT